VPWPASRAPPPVEPGRPRAAAWLSPAGGGDDLPDNPGFDVLAVVHVVEGSGGGAGVLARLGPAVQHGTRHRCPLGSPSRGGISVTSSSGLIVVICTETRPLQRNTRAEAVAHPAGVQRSNTHRDRSTTLERRLSPSLLTAGIRQPAPAGHR